MNPRIYQIILQVKVRNQILKMAMNYDQIISSCPFVILVLRLRTLKDVRKDVGRFRMHRDGGGF